MTATQISSPAATTARSRRLVAPGLAAGVAAALVTMAVGAILKAAGVDFELPDGGESIPVAGFASTTLVFSVVGVALAAALRRGSWRPRTRFVQVTVALTAVSLVPPFLVEANADTVASLVVLHLVAAGVAIPLIARNLAD